MKTIQLFLVSVILLFNSCKKENTLPSSPTGNVEFSCAIVGSEQGADNLKSTTTLDSEFTQAMVTIYDNTGRVVYDSKIIEIIAFGDSYLTKPLALKPGNYVLTQFVLLNDANEALYATPFKGSELAYLVNQPLPIVIAVSKDEVTKVVPEVISTSNSTPEAFGYTSFEANIVETVDFMLAVFVYNPQTDNFKLTDYNLAVYGNDSSLLFESPMEAKTNYIRVLSGFENYTLTICKNGYVAHSETLNIDSLLTYNTNPLTIVLQESSTKYLFLQPDSLTGKDTQLSTYKPDLNYAKHWNLQPVAWTFSGEEIATRSLVQFDLSSIPEGAMIFSAKLSLYQYTNPSTVSNGHSGENACVIQRVTSAWEESIVTWNTQPSTTDINQVALPNSITPYQDYADIDVTELVKDIISNPGSNYGFMLRLVDETPYRSLLFASSNCPVQEKHPKLVVRFK